MNWLWLVSYFFAAVFCGKRHPSLCRRHDRTPLFKVPLRNRPAKGSPRQPLTFFGDSSNAVVGYLLLARVGSFDPRATSHILAFGVGALLISISLARHFGQFYGGNTPTRP